MRTLRTLFVVLGCLGLCASAFGQSLPVAIRQDSTRYNLSSVNGVPLSSTVGVPPGSDGRAPNPGSGSIRTANQFQSAILFTSGVRPMASGLDPTKSLDDNANNLDLPRAQANAGRPQICGSGPCHQRPDLATI